jgi:MFS family permease
MTQAIELPLLWTASAANRLVGAVCFAHFVSHYYITLLAPLFVFVRDDFGVSYTKLGLALTAFNVVSTVLQTPTGFLVDRFSARHLIMGGLVIEVFAFTVAALTGSFWIFVAAFAIAGVGNTVYHPADYAILSLHAPAQRAGRLFAFHTFSGMIGNAAAPPTLLFMTSMFGWRGAFLGAAALGVTAVIVLAFQSEPQIPRPAYAPDQDGPRRHPPADWRILFAPAILLNLLFFFLITFSGGGLTNYLVAALGALYGTPPSLANAALTGLLTMSAVGVLVGGILAGMTSRHGVITASGLFAVALACALIGSVEFTGAALVMLMSAAGFCSGIAMPSRDMIVRSVTPPGAYGRVFGFVSTGFNIAGIVSPLIFGQLLDHGHVRTMFFFMAACALLAIATVAVNTSRRHTALDAIA